MKKSTIFLFTMGILLMIVGGLGSIYYYQRTDKTLHKVNKEYEILDKKNTEELQIKLANYHSLIILPSEDNKVHLEGNYYKQSSLDLDWEITEKNGKTTLDLSNREFLTLFSFNPFNLWNRGAEQIFLYIPEEFSRVTINNSNDDIELKELTLDTLTVTNKNGHTDLRRSTIKNIEVKSNVGDVYIGENTSASDIKVSTNNSDIALVNVQSEQISAKTNNGDIELDNIRGDITAKNNNGAISVRNSTENLDLQNQNGDISIQLIKIQQNITAHSSNGDISIECATLPTDTEISAHSNLGNVELFDKETTQYAKGTKKYLIKATSSLGDISVNREDFDNDYEEDID